MNILGNRGRGEEEKRQRIEKPKRNICISEGIQAHMRKANVYQGVASLIFNLDETNMCQKGYFLQSIVEDKITM